MKKNLSFSLSSLFPYFMIFTLLILFTYRPLYLSESLNAQSEKEQLSFIPQKDLEMIEWQKAYALFREKKKIKVALIDTGIDPTNPLLKESLFIPNGKITSFTFGVDFSVFPLPTLTPHDSHGHGTHIAGLIKSIYPNVEFLAIKYYNPQGTGEANLTSTLLSIKYAIDSNVDIINYSGGGPGPSVEELHLLLKAKAKGILVVTAAGNDEGNLDQPRKEYYPASYNLPHIITVSAHNKQLNLLPQANWGKRTVDIFAPGESIRSFLPQGRWGEMSGTSQATAFVTGVAALIKAQYPDLAPEEIKSILNQSARKHSSLVNKCKSNGYLSAYQSMKFAETYFQNKLKQSKMLAKNFGHH